MIEVTQADRKAAASVAVLVEMRELILAGRADHHAEPWAAHRIAALEEAAKVADDHCYSLDIDEFMSMTKKEHGAYACRSVATAIRAMKGPSNA